ncbi:MAG: hypothetical protein Q9214_004139, partial [Letrouitia sp. 1 TL-2023]
MLHSKTTDTNLTASTIPCPDSIFDSTPSYDTFSVQDEHNGPKIKTEEENAIYTNLRIPEEQQVVKREAQQQRPIVARPGHQEINEPSQCERAALRLLQPAPAAGTSEVISSQLQSRALEQRPCTPPKRTET